MRTQARTWPAHLSVPCAAAAARPALLPLLGEEVVQEGQGGLVQVQQQGQQLHLHSVLQLCEGGRKGTAVGPCSRVLPSPTKQSGPAALPKAKHQLPPRAPAPASDRIPSTATWTMADRGPRTRPTAAW